jgi:uncharacterized protein (TIGR02099 family)
MTTTFHHRFRLIRRYTWYCVAVVLVLMALTAGAVSQLLPLAERHPDKIAAWLSARAQRTVAFDRVETAWTRRGPLLRVGGLRIGDGSDVLPIGEAEILISQYAGLLPGRSFTELRLRGLDLTLQRGDDGRWQVRGLPGQQEPGGDPLSALEGLGELQVIGGKLSVIAPSIGIETTLLRVDLRLRVEGDRVQVATRAWMRENASPLDGALDFDRRRGDGRAWVALRRADLAAWSALRIAGVAPAAGSGRLSAWADLREHRITAVTLQSVLDNVRLDGAPIDAGDAHMQQRPHHDFGRIDALARWKSIEGGWRFDAPRLRIGSGNGVQVLDRLVIAGGAQRALLADRVDAGPLLALAALSERTPPALRHWLHDTAPGAVLHDVEIAGRRDGALRVQARVENFRFRAVKDAPGIAGLGGRLRGDADGFAFAFDPESQFELDWPRGFGAPHRIALRGEVSGWREGEGWQVATPALRIDGEGYGADVRGGMTFQGDGARPVVAIALALDESATPIAKRFWVRNRMPAATVRWLDAALLGGHVRNGRAIVAGDLDDWPFRGEEGKPGAGLFQAEADLADAVVKFQPGWPAAEHMDAHVVFVADGFRVAGKTMLADVAIPSFEGGIERFGRAELEVRANADSDAGKLLALLRQSPLREDHDETMRNLTAAGPVHATFALDLQMHSGKHPPRIDGDIELRDATLAESRWKLAFDDVNGIAHYDRAGFEAADLRAVRGGQPSRLALRAGDGHVQDPKSAFEGELAASLSVGDILDRAPQLAWLHRYVDGRSPWTVALVIPKKTSAANASAAAAGRLMLRSDLVGTRLNLPAPLDKPASIALPTRVETRLPAGEGDNALDVAVAFGEILGLRARTAQGRTGVRVALGDNRVAEAPPSSGLIATGRTNVLDAIGWATLATTNGADGDEDVSGSKGEGLPLQRIDIAADRLQLLGGAFADTRVRAAPTDGGTAVQFDGAALAGSLLLPRADGGTIAGRLQRLHWRSAKSQAEREAEQLVLQRGVVAEDNVDPATIPPLNLIVDDLRFGEAALGNASLQSQPIAAGMRIERLHARSPKQRIDVSGDWTGRGASARTRLRVGIDSQDFGALLTGFGFGGRIDGGTGEARFDAAWRGTPATFRLGELEGTLTLAIKDGRLAEVEPGAGRVLGLLSIAELPRRLTLDFRDFFSKGFAFNRIGGDVRFAGGQARSDNLVIDGPAAEIRIRGTADLRAQRYDQTIEVLPKTGNLLTAVGAITAGPVGAAVGAVANAVLKRPLGEFGARVYRVTGPWKDPKVEVASRTPPQAARQGDERAKVQ